MTWTSEDTHEKEYVHFLTFALHCGFKKLIFLSFPNQIKKNFIYTLFINLSVNVKAQCIFIFYFIFLFFFAVYLRMS